MFIKIYMDVLVEMNEHRGIDFTELGKMVSTHGSKWIRQ